MSDKVEEQFNIRVSQADLDEFHDAIKMFGGNISHSAFGRLALKYFIKALREKGALAMLSEIIDK